MYMYKILFVIDILNQRVPRCNASWINDSIQVHSHIDVSVAVATDGGLITPIIPATNNKSVVEISAAIRVRHFVYCCNILR